MSKNDTPSARRSRVDPTSVEPPSPGDRARFFAKVDIPADPDACWLWMAGKNLHGYGTFWYQGKMEKAHRVSWIIHNGPIPDWACMCHSCDNPPCVNPSHLFSGSHFDNAQDAIKKGRRPGTLWKPSINNDRISRVDPTPRDPASLTPVLDFEFEVPPSECGNCRRTIGTFEPFRTIAPSKTRYHATCVSKRIIGSNAADSGLGQTRYDKYGKPIR